MSSGAMMDANGLRCSGCAAAGAEQMATRRQENHVPTTSQPSPAESARADRKTRAGKGRRTERKGEQRSRSMTTPLFQQRSVAGCSMPVQRRDDSNRSVVNCQYRFHRFGARGGNAGSERSAAVGSRLAIQKSGGAASCTAADMKPTGGAIGVAQRGFQRGFPLHTGRPCVKFLTVGVPGPFRADTRALWST